VQVAQLYYNENLSQREIADRLGVSRSLIALYLQRAREQEIVKIQVIDPRDAYASLALELRQLTGLEHVEVMPHSHMSGELARRAIAASAAKFLETRLQDGDILGLGWGRTMTRMVELFAPSSPRAIDVVPLLGESGYTRSYSQMNQLVMQTAEHFGGTPHFLLTPMLVGSPELRDMLLNDPVVSGVVENWSHLTIACFGIGVLPPTPGMIFYIGEENLPGLIDQGAVGDVCVIPYDRHGTLIYNQLTARMIGIRPEQLKQARHRIAVTTGIEKLTSVIGALRTGLITALFIDAELARGVHEALIRQ
jgi:DNA-binding transcriptional regulator LsrR (DeoR family)